MAKALHEGGALNPTTGKPALFVAATSSGKKPAHVLLQILSN